MPQVVSMRFLPDCLNGEGYGEALAPRDELVYIVRRVHFGQVRALSEQLVGLLAHARETPVGLAPEQTAWLIRLLTE